MILLCCAQVSKKHFDALILFALQLEKRGHTVAIDRRFMADDITKQNKYEMAPFLADIADVSPTCVIVIGADAVSEEAQTLLADIQCENDTPIWALGYFNDLQSELNARNKLAFATGREPKLLNLNVQFEPSLHADPISPLVTEIASLPAQSSDASSQVFVYIPFEELEESDETLNQISVVNYSPNITLHLMTNAKGKDYIRNSRYADLSVFSYGELPPTDLLHYFDVLVFYGANVPGERMAALAVNSMGAGKVVIDCTESYGFVSAGAPVLKGPRNPSVLLGYLQDTVIKNRKEIGDRIRKSDWLRQFDILTLERELGIKPGQQPILERGAQTLFFPTNGNGLGHAQRCTVIAAEMTSDHACCFAAFPSCVDMVQKRGFSCLPMVPRSPEHSEEYASDLVNFLRLRSVFRCGDQLVFDGGYVFDSVYRLITKLQNPAVWIRRGLWRPEQINPIALERERAFSKVIVPTEAFSELNTDYSWGDHVFRIGPIVQNNTLTAKDIRAVRDKLGAELGRDFDTLVVSMLGGGVASERTAQTQLLCSLLERRRGCLHLIVAWPNAFVSSTLYGWENSRVVNTLHALDFCQAADLCISAAGYNSFHEILYARVPAILIPQSAPYLDDQERRASAAFERGLAGLVRENGLLTLEREVCAFLDDGKSALVRNALRDHNLPETGNKEAARLIEEGLSS